MKYFSGSSEPLAPRPGSSTGVPTQSRYQNTYILVFMRLYVDNSGFLLV